VNLVQHPLARINDSMAFCHHGGWYECDLQTHALCAGKLNNISSYAMFDYVECNFDNLHVDDADNTRLCAAKSSLDYTALWQCAAGRGPQSGNGMLIASAQLAASLGINSAPTVMLDGKPAGHSLTLQSVCDAYTGPKPKGCQQPPHVLAAKTASGPTCHV
jgi:hypothetical protein